VNSILKAAGTGTVAAAILFGVIAGNAPALYAEAIGGSESVQDELQTLRMQISALESQLRQNLNHGADNAGPKVTVGGQIRLDGAYNMPGGPSNYSMSTSAIPSPTAAVGNQGQFSMQTRSSKFWIKSVAPMDHGDLRTLIEIDFWGSAGTEKVSNSHNIRMRHAYAEYAGFTIGQTSSTFMHSGSIPDTISDAISDIYVRQPLIRFTQHLTGGDLQVALEQPETTLTDINGNRVIPDDDRIPDIAFKLAMRPDWGLFNLSGLVRLLRIDTGAAAIGGVPAGAADQAIGGAIFASARINMAGADNLRLGMAVGNALGRYSGYNSFNDATVDVAGTIHLQNEWSGHLAYQHWWDGNWHSSFVYHRSQIKNDLSVLPLTVFRSTQSIHGNLRWSPWISTSMGFEYIHANSIKENGEKSTLKRLHFQWVYKF